MRIKQRGKVGIDMKRDIRSTQSVSRRRGACVAPVSRAVSSAVRFTFAQLFFCIFWFTPTPI